MVTTLIGIDYGKKRTGVAVGNTLTGAAQPLTIIAGKNDTQLLAELSKIVREWQATGLVIGIPRQPDDTPHAMTQACLSFAALLRETSSLQVHEVDERYSSAVLGNQSQRRADGKVRAIPQDDKAAAVILQQYLDSLV